MKKDKYLHFRVTEVDYEKIKSKATKSKKTVSDFLLTRAMGKSDIVVEGLPEAIKELNRIGVNLNQLTKLCNEGRIYSPDLRPLIFEVKTIWQRLNSLTRKEI